MNTQLEEVIKQQKESWNKLSTGWKKWNDLSMKFTSLPGQEMLKSINWNDTFTVLDIATGTGEPALSAADLVPNGKVIATDLSEKMLAIAAENAEMKGLQNFETKNCSIYDLPFEDNYFDVVLCRFGLMLFHDIQAGLKEIKRVLKEDGQASVCVWAGPEKNPWVTSLMGGIKQFVELPPPQPDAPGMFRCAQPGYLKSFFEQEGFKNTREIPVDFSLNVDSIQTYWNLVTEMASPDALNNADEKTKENIKAKVFENASKFQNESGVSLPASAIIITAQK